MTVKFHTSAFLAASLIAYGGTALAQSYPSKTITLVVPAAPGGATDIFGRTIARELELRLKRSVIVANNSGAGGIIGTESVARAPADGHTLLLGYQGVITVSPVLQSKIGYDPEKDFMPISLLARLTFVLSVHPSVKASSVAEFVALAKSAPGKLNYGSAGVGTTSHLTMELFKHETGADIVHVAFRGSGPASILLLAGGLSASFENIATALPRIRAGELRALGVAGPERSALAPDIPTVAEGGVKGFDVTSWFGILVPMATPREPVDRLTEALANIMRTPEFRKRLMDMGLEPMGTDAGTFRAQISNELVKWRRIVKEANIQPQ